ncbi:MAG: hypothetical protein GY829_16325 [Gammaproteobacteria bacterium]|nr:hypothetical protein [Gammaproteobacteria bacterium]
MSNKEDSCCDCCDDLKEHPKWLLPFYPRLTLHKMEDDSKEDNIHIKGKMMNDIFELMLFLSGIEDEDYEDDEQLFYLLTEKYGVNDIGKFKHLIDDLLYLVEIGESPITKTLYKGFASDKIWLAKVAVE